MNKKRVFYGLLAAAVTAMFGYSVVKHLSLRTSVVSYPPATYTPNNKQPKESLTLTEMPEGLIIDVAQCKPESEVLSWDLGSEGIVVKGLDETRCLVDILSDMEGGGWRHSCRIPKSLQQVSIFRNKSGEPDISYSFDVITYCNSKKLDRLY